MHTNQYFVGSDSVSLEDFVRCCQQQTEVDRYPHAAEVIRNVVIYEGSTLSRAIGKARTEVMDELHDVLKNGPGVLVIKGGFADTEVVDRYTAVFERILAREAETGVAADHFAQAGANGRIWNLLQKSALESADAFIEYHANPMIDLVAEAWLGPYYQIASQVNIVRPGGQAQEVHRDYHLGFQDSDEVARFPLTQQILSQYLTLQGAIAHSDMPVESGPTLLLPFSQLYDLGYLAWRRPEFIDYFKRHAVQLPLEKGDLVFFSPALFHAAGSNRTADRQRIANLVQISAAYGKAMESIDRERISLHLFPTLSRRYGQQELDEPGLQAVVAAVADGYSFPTNLDTDPPIGGLAPRTAQHLLLDAVRGGWSFEAYAREVEAMQQRRRP